jgi:Helix-turn-helix
LGYPHNLINVADQTIEYIRGRIVWRCKGINDGSIDFDLVGGITRMVVVARLHWTYISGIERGKRNLGIENVVKLARALKVDVGQLFKGVH